MNKNGKLFWIFLKKNGTFLMFWAHLMENMDRISKRKWHTLLPICDASYCITLFNFGSYGSNSYTWILANSALDEGVEYNTTKLPNHLKKIQRTFKSYKRNQKYSKKISAWVLVLKFWCKHRANVRYLQFSYLTWAFTLRILLDAYF